MATTNVLTNAVQFLVAERVNMQPPAVEGAPLHVLQRALSLPTRRDEARLDATAVAHAAVVRWPPIVATSLIGDVRRRLRSARRKASPTSRRLRSRMVSETVSEMAERARREDPRRCRRRLERWAVRRLRPRCRRSRAERPRRPRPHETRRNRRAPRCRESRSRRRPSSPTRAAPDPMRPPRGSRPTAARRVQIDLAGHARGAPHLRDVADKPVRHVHAAGREIAAARRPARMRGCGSR